MADLDKKYYINAGPSGTFRPSGDESIDTTPQNIDEIFLGFGEEVPEKIVLYFHGGLVGTNSGLASAEFFTKSVLARTDAYPISFVWETGLLETLRDNLTTIHKTKLFKKLIEKIIKIAAKKLGIELDFEAASRGVDTLSFDEIQEELKTSTPFENYHIGEDGRSAGVGDLETLEAEIAEEIEIEVEMDDELQELLRSEKDPDELKLLNVEKLSRDEEERSRGIISTLIPLVKVTYRVVKRHMKNRDHGFYPTIIEELMREFYVADLGAWVWQGMKDKANKMWLEPGEIDNELDQPAGNYLLEKLSTLTQSHPGLKVDLVGHSAGAIAICHLMEQIKVRPLNININRVMFLAPACRCELFESVILNNPGLINEFRMFTMEDAVEIKDLLVPVIYTRSLLYFISGVLEDEGKSSDAFILGLQRHNKAVGGYKGAVSIEAVDQFLEDDTARAVYSITKPDALEGFRSESQTHGAFNDQGEATMDSVFHLIKHD